MKASELIAQCEHKPLQMECCRDCKGTQKDCKPNPLNWIDFCIANNKKLKQLGFDVFGK